MLLCMIIANKAQSNVRSYMLCNMLHINLDKSCFMHLPCNETTMRKETTTIIESKHNILEPEILVIHNIKS